MPRVHSYQTPSLQQLVSVQSRLLLGFERLNKAFNSECGTVRRSSDNTTKKFNGPADIAAFCVGTNGFLVTLKDQSAVNGFDYTQATNANQPKIFDSVTGLNLHGQTLCALFDGAATSLERAAGANDPIPVNDSDLTVAGLGQANGAAGQCLISMGGVNLVGNTQYEMTMRPGVPCVANIWGSTQNDFTLILGVNTWQYNVQRRASGSASNSTTNRQNKTNLTSDGGASGAIAIANAVPSEFGSGYSPPAAGRNVFWQGPIACMFYWQAVIANDDLTYLEGVLQRMWVQ